MADFKSTTPAPTVVYDRVVAIIDSRKHQAHNGKRCVAVSAVVEADDAFDHKVGKTWVQLEDGTKIALLNDEVRG